MYVYPLAIWVVLAVVAVINGIFREMVLVPRIGGDTGHVVSTGLLIAAILVVSYLYFARTAIDYTRGELLLIGVIWALLTVGFELVAGYLTGAPVGELLAQYDVLAGQVWVFVPLTLLVAPLLVGSYLSDR